jgi:hypothetical protein
MCMLRHIDSNHNMPITRERKGDNMILNSRCVHWWIIENNLVGRCKKCGAIRDFEKLRQEEKTRMANHSSKLKNPISSVPIF